MKKLLLIVLLSGFISFFLSAQDKPEKIEMKPALLVIDVQKAFLPMMSQEDQDYALTIMNWSIWAFRQYDLPVIRVYHSSEDYGVVPDSPGFEFADTLNISEDDPRIIKTYGSAFNKTKLDDLLKELDVNTLFMCGLSATGCVLATYMDAGNYDYNAFMIEDALLSDNAEHTNSIEKIFNTIDINTAYYMLKISRPK